LSVRRSGRRSDDPSEERAVGRTDKRYLLHLRFEDDVCRPSLRDVDDGKLLSFVRLSELLTFLVHEYDRQESCDGHQGTSSMKGEGER